jgi:anti-anti-sigma factor
MLKIHAKKLETVDVLYLQGQIVIGHTEALRNAVHSLVPLSAVILDLARVSTVDAHGLGVLLELREQTVSKRIHFKLMNVSKPMSQVLQITRLDSVFDITSAVEFFHAVPCYRRTSVAA